MLSVLDAAFVTSLGGGGGRPKASVVFWIR